MSLSHETLDPLTLDADAREALLDALYEVQHQVFEGVDRDGFERYVADPRAERRWLRVIRRSDGGVVGYYAVQRHDHVVDGVVCTVFRGQVALLPAYRGLGGVPLFGVRVALPFLLRHPLRPTYGLISPVHPGSYRLVCRYAVRCWPRPGAPMPARHERRLWALVDAFGLPRVPGQGPLVRQVGWATRDHRGAGRDWKRLDCPFVQYFLAENPTYAEGNGLLLLVPGSLPDVLGSLGLTAMRRLLPQRRKRVTAPALA
jgi:hypothetical protein